jgi:hypothetical protein
MIQDDLDQHLDQQGLHEQHQHHDTQKNYRGQTYQEIERSYLCAVEDENKFYELLVSKYGDIFTKLTRYEHFDFKTKNNDVYIEYKNRKYPSTAFDTLFIGRDKVCFMETQLHAKSKLKIYYINQFEDGKILYISYTKGLWRRWEKCEHKKQPLFKLPIGFFKDFTKLKLN